MSDIDISAEIARLNAARDQDAHEEYLKASEAITGKQSTNPVATWVRALPKNITVGVMDAGIAMAHAADDFDTAMADNQKQKAREQGPDAGPPAPTAQELRLASLATPMSPVERLGPRDVFARNNAYTLPAPAEGYYTKLDPQGEQEFQTWVKKNNVPFDNGPNADYDMRGFFLGLKNKDPHAETGVNQNDGKLHYSDYWKTPYHHSFSAESKFADPATAPKWNEKDQLVTPAGDVVFDERQHAQSVPSLHGEILPAIIDFRNEMARGSSMSDEITQSVAQYAIPFMGFSKLVGGLRGASWLGTAARTATAESATAGTVLEPHAGRGADLLAMGRTVEGKFGEALRTVSPDGSALNAYIDFMTDRDGETTGGGRFKNIIDNLALTGAVSGLIKVTAGTLKGGLAVAQYAAENAGVGPVGPAAQGGKIGISDTTHEAAATGQHTVAIKGIGEAEAQENGSFLQMKRIDVHPDARGQGAGVALLSRMADEAKQRGLSLASDISVSPSAARVYAALERRGYAVKRNPADVNPNTGNLVSKDVRVPIFEVTAKPGNN